MSLQMMDNSQRADIVMQGIYLAELEMEKVPTADVTKVICCKDCFYAKPYNAKWQLPIKEGALWCTHHEEEKTQGWFCADAIERMVEE